MKTNKIDFKNVKGTFDYYASELIIRNQIIEVLKTNFQLYGYLPLETPILCHLDLLSSKYAGGAEILKEVYKLTDQGERELGLRYDLTVPFAKVLASTKELSLPFKRYEIGKVFRDGPVKPGRNREFYQCDVDVCGVSKQTAEIEFFQLINKVFKELSLDVEIHYNNRKFLVGILQFLGIKEDLINRVVLVIDKIEKVESEEIEKELLGIGIEKGIINNLFNLFDKDYAYLKNMLEANANELLNEGIKELEVIEKLITEIKLTNCVFKPFLARGLEIYTGCVWEIFSKDGYRSSLGAGGRYDEIITKFIDDGNTYPAVGMSFGLEPIYEVIKTKQEETFRFNDVLLYSFGFDAKILSLADELRSNNIKVMIEMNNWKLKKALDYANKKDIPYVVIIGEDEVKQNKLLLRNMETGEQMLVDTLDIIKILKK